MEPHHNRLFRIVVAGAGFGGLCAAHALKGHKNVHITLIDRNNYHIFQPFLYQVASADLAPSDIAIPIRSQFKGYQNVQVMMDKVVSIAKDTKFVSTDSGITVPYDFLVLATGSESNFFGHSDWEAHTISLKSLTDALKIRAHILKAFEQAELNDHPPCLSFTIIGGGPTGVEMAGALQELIKQSLKAEFRHIDVAKVNIIVVEAASRLLPTFSESIGDFTYQALVKRGIDVKLNSKVQNIQPQEVILESGERIPSTLIIWAAGVKAAPTKDMLGGQINAAKSGKIYVERDLSLPGYPDIFVIGDASHSIDETGHPLPGLAAVATQQGKFVGKLIQQKIQGKEGKEAFTYKNRGNLAIIGRYRAVAEFKRIKLRGWLAWVIWDIVHIYFLIGFRNRLSVFMKWLWNYVTRNRSERIIIDVKD